MALVQTVSAPKRLMTQDALLPCERRTPDGGPAKVVEDEQHEQDSGHVPAGLPEQHPAIPSAQVRNSQR